MGNEKQKLSWCDFVISTVRPTKDDSILQTNFPNLFSCMKIVVSLSIHNMCDRMVN